MSAPEPRDRISKTTMCLMVSVGFIYDLIGLIPFVNIATAIIAPFHFWAWFKIKGAKYIEPKAADITKKVIVWILEAIPGVGEILPGITLQVFFAARKVRKDDKAYNDEQEKAYAIQRQKDQMEYQQKMVVYRQQEQENQDRLEQEEFIEQQRQVETRERFQNNTEQDNLQDPDQTEQNQKNTKRSGFPTDNVGHTETDKKPRTAYDRDRKAT